MSAQTARTDIFRSTAPAAAVILLALAVLGPACRPSSSGAAVVEEKTETVRTYPFSDPDPVPIFARSSMWGQGARLYPYFFFDRFTAEPVEQPWTVVRLSNPYIEVAVLPQAGGKVWGAADKATGREFLYWNKVLKFRQIALRGPWTSGGIEFNFGVVGHAPSTATPVDYILRRNPDGSASCVVGTMDLPSRTRWSVTVTLPKDSAAFETNAIWVNPTPFSQSYYAWSCAAVKTAEDLRYIFPGQWSIGHDYSVPLEPWPIDRSGRDLSLYSNNATPGSKSYFTVGEYADFYGGWYEKSDAGFGHWSRYEDMPGRKVWIWDLSRSGEIWVDLLTDTDGQYTEPQAGRLLNQSDHGDFAPGSADRWQEQWFPYRGIGPMAQASPHAVLSAARTGAALGLGLFPLRPVADDLVVSAAGREIFRERLTLRPEQIWKKDVPLTGAADADPLEVRLGAKLVWRSAPEADDLGRPLRFSTPAGSSAEALYLQARGPRARTAPRGGARQVPGRDRRGAAPRPGPRAGRRALHPAGRTGPRPRSRGTGPGRLDVRSRSQLRLRGRGPPVGPSRRRQGDPRLGGPLAAVRSRGPRPVGRDRRPGKRSRPGRRVCPQGPRLGRPERRRPRDHGRGPPPGRPEGRGRPRPRLAPRSGPSRPSGPLRALPRQPQARGPRGLPGPHPQRARPRDLARDGRVLRPAGARRRRRGSA